MSQSNTTKVVTGKVRFSYANLFQPRAMVEGQDPKYSVCLLINKQDTATIEKIKNAIDAAISEGMSSKWGGRKPANLKLPLRDGDMDRTGQPEYAGHYFVNASSMQAPGVVDQALNPVMDPTEVYSGCYGRASVNFYTFDKAGNRGVACGLQNVQKLSDGEPFSGRTRAEDDFADNLAGADLLG